MSLLESNGIAFNLTTEPIAAVSLATSVALITIDGDIYCDGALVSLPEAMSVTCAQADRFGTTIFIGTEKGDIYSIKPGNPAVLLAQLPRKWIEHIIALPDGGCIVAIGKLAVRISSNGEIIAEWAHTTAITGLALDPKMKRVACSHFNGVSLWWLTDTKAQVNLLSWQGIHTDVSWSPCGKFIVSMMQDNALHGWRIMDKLNMRMAGYPSRCKSMAWTADGKYLATSGAPPVVCWPFMAKDGPMGKAPIEMPPENNAFTTTVACHPNRNIIAAGYEDGRVLMFRLEDQADIAVADATDTAVCSLAFSGDGNSIAFARTDGSAGTLSI
jgi:WD40 repeat protein